MGEPRPDARRPLGRPAPTGRVGGWGGGGSAADNLVDAPVLAPAGAAARLLSAAALAALRATREGFRRPASRHLATTHTLIAAGARLETSCCMRCAPPTHPPTHTNTPLLPPPAGGGDKEGGKKKETKLGLTASKDGDFGEWYSQVVVESEMISYYDVSGEERGTHKEGWKG